MTDQTQTKAEIHAARNAELKAQGDARRAEKKAAGLAKQAEFLAGLKKGKIERKAARIEAHNDRNAQAKKPAKAA